METKRFDAGDIILREGDPSDYAYILRKGKAEVIREHLGNTIILRSINRGDIFGEFGIIDNQPRSATVRAVEPVTVSVLSNDEVVDIVFDNPHKSLILTRSAFDRLRKLYAEKEKPEEELATELDSFRSEMSEAIAQAIRDHEEGVMKSHVGILPIASAVLVLVLVGGSILFKAQILDFLQTAF
ncbi:cyclic nucleotide-binding domain-containing protein [Leptothoe spongobia]|uniref:Cyclic nucleotide-binding domain-containing protein n=1 Tax=Leptothoe spongobia TAU-MAC 1115 TaxID=1967444 RepID=A0A947DDS1_9CYAN|nr:cyclic nucleotide-binding domain-containing protein [Leptothoe spongobia]MBT9314076.1 cyclic nucleotide-binding domain-containing protein [Leptothoe spongobia TAU-MAC 1115]